MIKVLVADDQMLIRAGLAAIIRATPGFEVVGEAANGQEAVTLGADTCPDVILMDIRMPGLSGIAATEQIVAVAAPSDPCPKVLILTTFDLDEYVYAALHAGASGFLLKDTGPERLLSAIKTVAGGDMLFAPTVVRRLIEAHAPLRQDEPAHDLQGLTGRELDVLRLVAKGLSNAEVATRLFLSEATVKTHLNRIMGKLGLNSRAQAVVVAYETGLVIPSQRPTRAR